MDIMTLGIVSMTSMLSIVADMDTGALQPNYGMKGSR